MYQNVLPAIQKRTVQIFIHMVENIHKIIKQYISLSRQIGNMVIGKIVGKVNTVCARKVGDPAEVNTH